MGNGQRSESSLGYATDLILKSARAYQRGKYLTIRVFSKKERDMICLCKHFGGNYYRHGSGFIWAIGDAKEQWSLLATIGETIPDKLKPLRDYFLTEASG